MVKKIISLVILFVLAFVSFLMVTSGATIGSNVGSGGTYLTVNPNAKSYWRKPYLEGVRITLVDRDTGVRIPGTRSVDYVNQSGYNYYLSPSTKRSKIEYMNGASIGNRSNFVTFSYNSPPAALPVFVLDANPARDVMSRYFMEGYSPTTRPQNLKRLLRDLNQGGTLNALINVVEDIETCGVNQNCEEVNNSPQLRQFNNYVFLAESIGFVTLEESDNVHRNYALTSTELGQFLPDFPGFVRGYSHGSVPMSMYLLSDEFSGGNRLRRPTTPTTSSRYTSNQMRGNLGVGVGVFDIIFDGEIDPPCTPEPEFNVDNCDSELVDIFYRDDSSFKCLLDSDEADRVNKYCSFVCREEARAIMPNAQIKPYDQTHFTYGPPKVDLSRRCLLEVEMQDWFDDYQRLVQQAENQYEELRQARIRLKAYELSKNAALNNSSITSERTEDGNNVSVQVERYDYCLDFMDPITITTDSSNPSYVYDSEHSRLNVSMNFEGYTCDEFSSFPDSTHYRRVYTSDVDQSHLSWTECRFTGDPDDDDDDDDDDGGPIIVPMRNDLFSRGSFDIAPPVRLSSNDWECHTAVSVTWRYRAQPSNPSRCNLSGATQGRISRARNLVDLHDMSPARASSTTLRINTKENGPFSTTRNAGVQCTASVVTQNGDMESYNFGTDNTEGINDGNSWIEFGGSFNTQQCIAAGAERVQTGDRYRYRYRVDGGAWTGWLPPGGTCDFENLGSYQATVNNLESALRGTLSDLNGLRNMLDTCVKSFNIDFPELPIMEAIHNQDNFDERVYQLRRETVSREAEGPTIIESSLDMPASYFCENSNLSGCRRIDLSTSRSGHGMAIDDSHFVDSIQGSITHRNRFVLEEHVNKYVKIPENVTNDNMTFAELRSVWAPHYNSGRIRIMEEPNYAIQWEEGMTNTGGTLTYRFRNMSRLNEVYSGSQLESNGQWFNYTCPYEVKTSTPIDEENPRIRNVLFRTIDLDNPFVTYTGEEREPGFNWRVEPEYIDEIKNNRNVSGNDLYRSGKEPMFVIDFTGANRFRIREIREYNNNTRYDDFRMNCQEGIMCRSTFLRENPITRNVVSGCASNATVNNWDNPCND